MVNLHNLYKIQVHEWYVYVEISTMILTKYPTHLDMTKKKIHP